jgi:hypothetical protein
LPSDGKKNEVLKKMCIVPECAKKPEPAGWAYSKLQKKHYRINVKAGNVKDDEGNVVDKEELSDSEDEFAIVLSKEDEKWVPTRTRAQFIKCALDEDFYGLLDLVPFTLPFYSAEHIEK